MTRIISIVSGKGGVGKTLIATNLSYALSHFGFKTLLIDFNFTTPHIPIFLSSKPTFTLNDFLQETADFHEILNPALNFFYISPSINLEEISTLRIENLERLKRNLNYFDFVIIDSAPGFGKEALLSFNFSDEILIVSNPTLSSLFDTIKCIQLAKRLNKKILGIIVNRYENSSPLTIKDFQNLIYVEIISVVSENKKAKYCDLTKNLLYNEDKNFREEINRIVSKIANIEIQENKFKLKDFFKKMFRILK